MHPALVSARFGVVGFVGVRTIRLASRPAPPIVAQRRDGIEGGAIIPLSCRSAPLQQTPSGVPRTSVTRWRFVPPLPQSVGFRPVAGPSLYTAHKRRPGSLADRRFQPPRAGTSRAPDAGGSAHQPLAGRADANSISSRSRRPSPPGAYPEEHLRVARTEC